MSTIARRKIITNRIAELCAEAFTYNGVSDVFNIQDLQKSISSDTGAPMVGRENTEKAVLLFSNTLVSTIEDNDLIRHIDDNVLNGVPNNEIANKFFIRDDLFGIAIDATGMAQIEVDGQLVWQEEYLYNIWFTAQIAENPPVDSTPETGIFSIENMTLGGNNPYNISQYIDFNQMQQEIDLIQAKKVLDLDITELIPTYITQQQKIDKFFNDYLKLRGEEPNWQDLDADELWEELSESDYLDDISNRISSGNNIGYITRLDESANEFNVDKTLQWLRNDLNRYLKDIDKIVTPEFTDERPEYENVSNGFIKLRALNQGIIIRKQEGLDVGMSDYVETDSCSGPSFQCDGFTISMWVKFLDRVNTGTLFNYGNPIRAIDPRGFQLQTYVLYADDVMTTTGMTWGAYADSIGQGSIFADDYARFVRLIVRDNNDFIRDNHIGYSWSSDHFRTETLEWNNVTYPNIGSTNEHLLLNYTQIPIDFEEWYYIVATYDPSVEEDTANGISVYDDEVLPSVPLWWLGHYWLPDSVSEEPSTYSADSGYGAKCKIEFISKSRLLRARGYKPE
tara:strand:+ start:4648 stop:6342 length:1695 start_codon:yes stop_codon:yes gene_type:complete